MEYVNSAESEFADALKKGLGRAMLLLRKDPRDPALQEQLLHACKTNLVYDPQCEPRRAPYLCRLIREIDEDQFFWNTLRHAFEEADKRDDCRNHIQMFQVLCALASSNSEFDRDVLRSFLRSADYATVGKYCMGDLVQLEGVSGLTFCFHTFAVQLPDSDWPFRSLVSELEKRDGGEAARVSLQQARKIDPEFDRLMRAIDSPEPFYDQSNEGQFDREEVELRVRNNSHVPYTWIRDASDEDIEWLAHQLIASTDDRQIFRYLRMFQRRMFPLDPKYLMELVKRPHALIGHAAANALSLIGDAKVRAFALELMSDRTRVDQGVLLLRSNWRECDVELIETILKTFTGDDYERHKLESSISDVLDDAPVPDTHCHDLWIRSYRSNPCSQCRLEVVIRLFDAGKVPAWMEEECRYDAVPDIVALFAR